MKPLIPARRRGIVYVQLISRLYNRPVEGCLPMFKVLVVEDDRDLRQLFARVLQRSGYETLEAGDGQQALEVLEREYVDVIISDIMMPVMDGYELVRSLREADMKMPVLMITAKDAFDDMRRGFLSGTDDYMIKPVNVNEMVLRVGALLRRAQMISERREVLGGTVLQYDEMTVCREGESVTLPQKEFQLLYKWPPRRGASSPGSRSWTISGGWIPKPTRTRWMCTSAGCAIASAKTRTLKSSPCAASATRW